MTIALISDTHGPVPDDMISHLMGVDEIWHAGDIGEIDQIEKLQKIAPTRAVFGNIDIKALSRALPEHSIFELGGVKVYMTHIGGYPGRYRPKAKEIILREKPDLFISGHSHILKVMRDTELKLLHMNPGACGYHGFHKMRTMLKFEIDHGKITNLRLIELGLRGLIRKKKDS